MAKKRASLDALDLAFASGEKRNKVGPDLERIGDAYAEDAFGYVRHNKLKFPSADEWANVAPQSANERTAPRFPTRAKYWERYDIARLRKAVALPGEPKSRVARRVALANSYTGTVREYEKSSGGFLWWAVEVTGNLTAITNSSAGPQHVAHVTHQSPWFMTPRDEPPTPDAVRSVYLDVVRSMIRATTGFSKGPSGERTDGRHGPEWSNERAPKSSEALNTLRKRGISYENSVLFPDQNAPGKGMRLLVRTTAPGRKIS